MLDVPPYRGSLLHPPTNDLRHTDPEGTELIDLVFSESEIDPLEADPTIQAAGDPIGERIRVSGRVVNGDGEPVRNQLVEVWQANAAGRYIHRRDQHPAPIDRVFTRIGRCLTDEDGRYSFATIKPRPSRRAWSCATCSAWSSPTWPRS